jgi:beta-galactosidase
MREITRRDLVRSGMALSATSVINGSAIARAATLLSANSAASPTEASTALAPREQLLFDFGWKFAF